VENVTFKTGLAREPRSRSRSRSGSPAVTVQPAALALTPAADAPGATGQVLASIREDLDPKTLASVRRPAFVAAPNLASGRSA
jgi:hypothetical protein